MELALPPEVPDLLHVDRPVTADELLQQPEGPPYFELFDGEVIEVGSPDMVHQLILRALFRLLDASCPTGFDTLFAPLDWVASEYELYEPDLMVVRTEVLQRGDRYLHDPPELCVEVVSPTNRRHDLIRKRRAYERAGVGSYWIVDPDPPGGGDRPRLLALDLVGGSFVEAADVAGSGVARLPRPFPVTVVPAELAP